MQVMAVRLGDFDAEMQAADAGYDRDASFVHGDIQSQGWPCDRPVVLASRRQNKSGKVRTHIVAWQLWRLTVSL